MYCSPGFSLLFVHVLSSIIFPSIAHTHTHFPLSPLIPYSSGVGFFSFVSTGFVTHREHPLKTYAHGSKRHYESSRKHSWFDNIFSSQFFRVHIGVCALHHPAAVSTEGVEEDVRTSTEKGDGVFLSLSFLRLQLTRHHHLPPSSSDRERFALYSVANRKILHIWIGRTNETVCQSKASSALQRTISKKLWNKDIV